MPLVPLTIVLATLNAKKRVRAHWLVGTWMLGIATTLLPFDVTLHNAPGPPHLVPLIMGLPAPQTLDACARGEAVCGGCVVSVFEPTWLLIW